MVGSLWATGWVLCVGCSDPAATGSPSSSSGKAAKQSGSSRNSASSTTTRAGRPSGWSLRETVKVEQLIGDYDKHLKRPTTGQTWTRFGVSGVDLGYPFEANGKLLFLFGDTIGTEGQNGQDAIARTDDLDPEDGVALDFYARADGRYLPFRPRDDQGMERKLLGFEVPVAGIQLEGKSYVAYKDNHAGDEDGSSDGQQAEPTDITQLALFDTSTGEATRLCELSRQPNGRFNKVSFRLPVSDTGLPPGGPWVLMHGTGRHRASHAYLAIIPVAGFARCEGQRYFVKRDGESVQWSESEADARPVFTDGEPGTLGEISVTWAAAVGEYIATYDAKPNKSRQVVLRHSKTPWGPWTDPMVLFDPIVSGRGVFLHDPSRNEDDGQAGPMIGKKHDPEKTPGTSYAPFVVERWTRLREDVLSLYFVLSTWNPYVVVLMRSDLHTGP